MKDQTKGLYQSWLDVSTISEGDTISIRIKKMLIRVTGILFLIVFSPLILLIVLFAFLFAV